MVEHKYPKCRKSMIMGWLGATGTGSVLEKGRLGHGDCNYR